MIGIIKYNFIVDLFTMMHKTKLVTGMPKKRCLKQFVLCKYLQLLYNRLVRGKEGKSNPDNEFRKHAADESMFQNPAEDGPGAGCVKQQ